MIVMPETTMPHSFPPSSGARLSTADGRELPLKATRVIVDACAGSARVKLEQRFVNPFAEPLNVTYQLPLPADGAVAGFSFVLEGVRVVGRIEKRADAREQFEQAIVEGKSAALLEQERSSLFHQEIGNLPPGSEVSIEVVVDQPLVWLKEGDWEWRWPCVVAPRYLGSPGRVAHAENLVTEVHAGVTAEVQLALSIRDRLRQGAVPQSPSHPLASVEVEHEWRVVLGGNERSTLDRDLVVRWAVASAAPGVSLDAARGFDAPERAFGLLTLVPPALDRPMVSVPRDLIVLIDTSGSMYGKPLDQAKQAVSALVRGLGPNDQIELIAFSSRVTHFKSGPMAVTDGVRAEALCWIQKLSASGGTEMREGILSALAELRPEAQRQVVLVTDGLIGFETEVIREILHRLPGSSRLHTLGVGSSVNRSLMGPAARAGRGSEHILGLDEDIEPMIDRLCAKLEAPIVTHLSISGTAMRGLGRARLPALHAGSPVLIPIELDPNGGSLLVEGTTQTGTFRHTIEAVRWSDPANARVKTLFGRECAEDIEMQRAAGKEGVSLDQELERLGLEFQISTRMTSWVAVSEEPSVDPTRPFRRVIQPQALPYGLSAEGLGLRPAFGNLAFGGVLSGQLAFGLLSSNRYSPEDDLSTFALGELNHMEEYTLAESPRWLELTGKVLTQKPERLVILAALEDDLDWELPDGAELELDDETALELDLVQHLSTASGRIEAGCFLRIVLRLKAPLSRAPTTLIVGSLHIVLSR